MKLESVEDRQDSPLLTPCGAPPTPLSQLPNSEQLGCGNMTDREEKVSGVSFKLSIMHRHLPLQCPLYSRFRASLGHAGPSFPQGLVLDPSTQKSFCLHYSEICPSPEGGGPSSRLHYLMITATQSKTELHGHTRYSKQQFYL